VKKSTIRKRMRERETWNLEKGANRKIRQIEGNADKKYKQK
jgi:hypothetical protein